MEHGSGYDAGEAQPLGNDSRAEPYLPSVPERPRYTPDGYAVQSDLPESLPVTAAEIALLRAFLSDEINAILYGEDRER